MASPSASSLVRPPPAQLRPLPLLLSGRTGARVTVSALALLTACAAAALVGSRAVDRLTATALPRVPHVAVYRLFVDDTPVRITVSAEWQQVPYVATADAIRNDVTVWRRMRVADWDTVPSPLREEGLEAMFARHAAVLSNPGIWDGMTAHDWDLVPQPVRAFAFTHMAAYWVGYYDLADRHGLPPGRLADTAAAIIMSESWFEHRAEHVNPWGNRDIGLSQASGFARRAVAGWHASGRIDLDLADEDYFNPWYATRFVALWLDHLLVELDGDLDAAVRAYHRGAPRARRGDGQPYLDAVLARRSRYMRNQGASAAWTFLWQLDRRIMREAWPWLRARRVGAGRSASAQAASDPERRWWLLVLTPAPSLDGPGSSVGSTLRQEDRR